MLCSRFLNLVSATALILLLAVISFGCRGLPPAPATPLQPNLSALNAATTGTPAAGPLTLTLWHSETGAARDELGALARDFHSAYPEITVNPIYVGNSDDLAKQVTAGIALRHAPDLVLATRRDLAQFARLGGLTPLDELASDPSIGLSEDDRADLLPGLIDESTFPDLDNKLYGFPFDEEGLVLFYNAEMLKAIGADEPPTTWDDFVDQASRTTREQQYGWAMPLRADIFNALLASQGSALLDKPERRALFAENAGVVAMTMCSQLYKSGVARPMPSDDAAFKEFGQGHSAFLLDWMTRLGALQAAQQRAKTHFEIGVAGLPQADPNSPAMLIRGYDLGILKMSPARARTAWFFIRWLTSTHQSARWTRAAGALPLRVSALSELAHDVGSNPQLAEIQSSLGGILPHLVPRAANKQAPKIEQLEQGAWSQILYAKADIATALTLASTSATQLLATTP